MKRILAITLILCLMILCGCGVFGANVKYLKGGSFQYNEGTDDYSLFFGLCDRNERYVSADATVSIRIENENGDIVYEGEKNITKNDFDTYSNQITGERFLANVRIKASEIAAGSSSSGTVYFSVSDGKSFGFDECNCSALSCLPVKDIQITVMKGWSFQYNEGTDDYSLFFGLCDRNESYVSADATVSIRIENENGDIVYEGEKNITKNDFDTYSNHITGERFLANVRIKASEIAAGSSSSGTVYFSVSDGKSFGFDECNCSALYCLPVKDIQITVMSLPAELSQRDYFGSIESKLLITDVQYSVDNGIGTPKVSFVISGEKTYGNSSSYSNDIISYKLYDHEGYLVKSGQIILGLSLNVGDRFRNNSLMIYDLTPGEEYTLELLDYGW